MGIWRLVWHEILYRRLGFVLSLMGVTVAAGALTGALTLLSSHDLRTEDMLRGMEDDLRKITKGMGFNIVILPEGQNLSDFFAEDYASRYMSEEYVTRLADSRIMTVRHLLPSLQQKLVWPERSCTIILVGVRGETPLLHRSPRKPMMDAVPPGGMVLGHALGSRLGLGVGDKVRLMAREFTVTAVHKQRGTKDDITAWIDLAAAQELLDKRGLINAILALECNCAWADLPKVREEIAGVLPGTQVIERTSKALARAEARNAGAKARAELRSEREGLASVLVPVVIAACGAWVMLLSLTNVRDRRGEIGVLRALGMRSSQILLIFLLKALIIGLVGGALGYLSGWTVGGLLGDGPSGLDGLRRLFRPEVLGLALAGAPALALVGTWIPALAAAQTDPARTLKE